MSFKDLLYKYNNGTASIEEIKLVEEELGKYEAIEEYLSEKYNLDFEKDSLSENINNEAAVIKRNVNKKLRKVILTSVSIVFLILFTTYYIVSPLVSSFYYNPSKKTVGKYFDDLYFDLRAYTELNFPGYALYSASSEKLGFGEYDMYFERENLFNRESKNINAKIKSNHIMERSKDFSPFNLGFWDIIFPSTDRDEINKTQDNINYIKELNPVSYVSASIIFKDDLSIKEFDDLQQKYFWQVQFKWAGVRTVNPGEPTHFISGFNHNSDGSRTDDSADKDKYPYLQLADYFHEARDSIEEAYTKHFISLLTYMNDRQQFVKSLSSFEVEYYKNALNYVEKNGINIYGVLVYGEARDLLEFIDNEQIKTIEINSVLPSKYMN
ncbi:anti sigma factor C-terminal domain-containing protein [uncultured Clostridium sp.]|uniref:anti sigma factor C-terminal domain-containing protein n=1 Tax=uncultured Clostridium sp. TaxID=59620 RepID=UPI0028E4D69D|nr:anti sigma factor C-terminal domain-containing protein [uncultured Clostridium sp.]